MLNAQNQLRADPTAKYTECLTWLPASVTEAVSKFVTRRAELRRSRTANGPDAGNGTAPTEDAMCVPCSVMSVHSWRCRRTYERCVYVHALEQCCPGGCCICSAATHEPQPLDNHSIYSCSGKRGVWQHIWHVRSMPCPDKGPVWENNLFRRQATL